MLTAGGFEPPVPGEAGTPPPTPAALAALASKDAGPPLPSLTAAQLKELTGGKDPAGMPLPERNPLR